MEDFWRQIEQAMLPPGVYYLSLAGALMIPSPGPEAQDWLEFVVTEKKAKLTGV